MIWPFKKRKPKPRRCDQYRFDPQPDLTAVELARISASLYFWPDTVHDFEKGWTPAEHFAQAWGMPEIARHFVFVPDPAQTA